MWKKLIEKLGKAQKELGISEYCLYCLNLMKLSTLTEKEINHKIKLNPNNDFFPEHLNVYNYFTDGEIEFVINYILFFKKLDNNWFDLDNIFSRLSEEQIYNSIFSYENEQSLFKRFIVVPENLLDNTFNENKLKTFLFLFFLPLWKNQEMLFNSKRDIPLICCSKIHNKAFDILFELTVTYKKQDLKKIIHNKNINHLLIQNFMENSSELHSFESNPNWGEILPIYKIKKFIDINCSVKNIKETIPSSLLILFEEIPEYLINFETKYLYEKLNKELSLNYKKEPIKKI